MQRRSNLSWGLRQRIADAEAARKAEDLKKPFAATWDKARLAAGVEPHPLTIAPTRNGKAIPVVVFESIGKTADAHKGSPQACQQMGLSAAEFADVQIKQ